MSPISSITTGTQTPKNIATTSSFGLDATENSPEYVINPASSDSLYARSEYSIDSVSRLIPNPANAHGNLQSFTPAESSSTYNNGKNISTKLHPAAQARLPAGLHPGDATGPLGQKRPKHGRGLSMTRFKPASKLHQASSNGRVDEVSRLLAAGANVSERDWSGKIALHRAASAGHAGVIEVLLAAMRTRGDGEGSGEARREKKVHVENIDARAAYTQSSLGAHMYGQTMYGNTISDVTPLHRAVGKGNLEVVELLLDAGADIEARTSYGQSPLHFAAENGRAAVVQLLLARGADTESKTGVRDRTALRLAAHGGHEEIMRMIVQERKKRGLPPIERVQEDFGAGREYFGDLS